MGISSPTSVPPEDRDLDAVDGLAVVKALSDPVRLAIVRQLAKCSESAPELRCGQIAVPVTKSTATHHFKVLYEAGIVGEREQGPNKYMHLRRRELDSRFPGLLDSILNATAPTA